MRSAAGRDDDNKPKTAATGPSPAPAGAPVAAVWVSSPQITYRRGASGVPTPALRGTGIRVQTLVVAAKGWELSPEKIAADYDLAESQVKEALAFYDAHRVEIDAAIVAEQELETTRA